ncbi:ABC transporter substrate-binding protein [Labrys wisconsinensis]|uniref:Multiple sugar transport system substrate-binding protein n=1 Tax=Labrys wisconsinensis TaxID=425677 RepID=A0ABU0JIH3_9HYPH|nr:extracellular solute-binding protein [Labrys wisconsinensis]MDQ0474080.1 multiple sugar transport system substrate-binding protein [Labrys wisconsinensis]
MPQDIIDPLTRRALLQAGSGALAAAALAGASVAPARAAGSGTVRVLSVEDPFFFSMKAMLPEFEKETGLKVELESLSYDALQARLVSSFVAKTSDADVITVDQMWSGQYLDNGWVTPLDDFIKADKAIDLGDFIPEVLYSSNIWKGRFVTLPVAAYAQGVIYRKDLFGQFGVKAPPKATDEAWTWDAYLQTLQSLAGKQAGGKPLFPTVVCGSQPTPIVHMFTQVAASNGARWFKSFPESPWDFTPQLTGDAWAKSVALYQELYKLSPPEAINYVWFDAGTRFAAGDIGMFYWWTPYFYLVKNSGYMTGKKSDVMETFDVGALPKAAGVKQNVSIGGWSLGIPSSSSNQQNGWAFLKWATSAATQKKMALWPDLNYQFSDFARRSLYKDADVAKVYPYLDVQLAMMEQGNGKISRPPVPGYTALEGVLGLQLNQFLSGGGEVAAGLKQTDELFKNVLGANFLLPYKQPSFDDSLEAAKGLIKTLS